MNKALLEQTEGYNVSSRYNVIPTMEVVNEFERFGFELSSVDAARVANPSKEDHQQHMVRMKADMKMVGGLRPEVIIHNSYDGTKALNIRVGLFRFVCSNGIVVGENLVPNFSVKHSNSNWVDMLHEFIDSYEEKQQLQQEWVNNMMERRMTLDEAYHMAEQALAFRHIDPRITNDAVDPLELLIIKRREDKGDSAWERFNVLQESIVNGQYHKYGSDGKIHKARVMTNVEELIRVNTDLSDLFHKELIV